MQRGLRWSIAIFLAMIFLWTGLWADGTGVALFTDVPKDHWAAEDIQALRALGITDGIGNNQFGLGKTISRSEFTAYLVRLMGWTENSPEQGSFTDVQDQEAWYYGVVETAAAHDVIDVGGAFRPLEPITREEMAVMLVRALGYHSLGQSLAGTDTGFVDVKDNAGYIQLAKDFGIVNGITATEFQPKSTATREQAAAMMMRMYQKKNQRLTALNGFYAIHSYSQKDIMEKMDSVGFGWSRLEKEPNTGQAVLRMDKSDTSDFSLPAGFEEPVELAKKNGGKALLMVFAQGNDLLQPMLSDPVQRQKIIGEIGNQVKDTSDGVAHTSFDGVIIDFEALRGSEVKPEFVNFLVELKQAMAQDGKLLYVAVNSVLKPGEPYYDGYDYRGIGDVADKVILMAHDYYAKRLTEADMENGYTMTPLTPIDNIYFALKAITDPTTGVQDKNKIMLQLSMDTVQWKLKNGQVINALPYHPSYEAVESRLLEGGSVEYTGKIKNPRLMFQDLADGTDNVVWYEDSRSVQDKIDLAKLFGVTELSVWRIGLIPNDTVTGGMTHLDIWQTILTNR